MQAGATRTVRPRCPRGDKAACLQPVLGFLIDRVSLVAAEGDDGFRLGASDGAPRPKCDESPAGRRDDRGAAHRHARVDPGQRFLRRRRVLPRSGTPLSPRTDRGRRCPCAARAARDRRDQRVPLSVPAWVTFASIGIGFLGEPAVADLIHPWLGGSLSHGLALAISLTIAYVLTTALHITIGEQVPKLFAISRAEAMARSRRPPPVLVHKGFSALRRRAQRRL